MLSPQRGPSVDEVKYAALRLAQLADYRGRVIPLDLMGQYIVQKLYTEKYAGQKLEDIQKVQKMVMGVIETLKNEGYFKLKQQTVLPIEVGYCRSDSVNYEKRCIEGAVISEEGKSMLESLYEICHHSFGIKLFPNLDTGC